MSRDASPEPRCKCRQCGAVVSARSWNATPGGAACPSCGHAAFSISFSKPAAPATPSPTLSRPGTVDAHGRHRKRLRREDLAPTAPAPAPNATFERRLRERLGVPPVDLTDDDQE